MQAARRTGKRGGPRKKNRKTTPCKDKKTLCKEIEDRACRTALSSDETGRRCCPDTPVPIASRQNEPGAAQETRREQMDRRTFLAGTAAALATPVATPALAQDYPARPVTLVNPFPPGGAVDVVGRPFAAALEPLLKQPVVVETKSGAAGAVGAQFAASCQAGRLHAARAPAVDFGLRRGGQAVRPHAEVHPRRLHPDRAADRRPDGARRQRSGAVQDAEGIRRRRQAESRTS